MDCDQARLLMAPHLAGSDTPEEWQALRHHLRSCPSCRAEAEALIGTWNLLSALPDVEVPASVWSRIQAHLPAPQPAGQRTTWAATAATAALAVLMAMVASWLLPFERAAAFCSQALRDFFPAAPDPGAFIIVGFLYGLLPLGLATLAAAGHLRCTVGHPGITAAMMFSLLAVPYVVIACAGLPAAFVAALLAGILIGALAGGPAGLWVGERFLPPART